jgi:hypothetical protein
LAPRATLLAAVVALLGQLVLLLAAAVVGLHLLEILDLALIQAAALM